MRAGNTCFFKIGGLLHLLKCFTNFRKLYKVSTRSLERNPNGTTAPMQPVLTLRTLVDRWAKYCPEKYRGKNVGRRRQGLRRGSTVKQEKAGQSRQFL